MSMQVILLHFFCQIPVKCFTPKSIGHIVSMKVVEGTTCSADAYTDLGLENIASENENQYDPLSCQENYINVNIV